MIYVRLAGGLGNQLFQIAAAMHLAQHQSHRICIQTAALARYEVAREPDALRLVDWPRCRYAFNGVTSSAQRWLVDRGRIGRWLPLVGVHDSNFKQIQIAQSTGGWRVLDGYFQEDWAWDTLSPCIEALAAMVESRLAALEDAPSQFNGCRVHVRGGDFLRLPAYAVATQTFYRSALAIAFAEGHRKFDVVTDDEPYSRALLVPLLTALGEHIELTVSPPAADPLTDLLRLRHSACRVIGNSTFAWWAAALDRDHGKTISPDCVQVGRLKSVTLPWELCLNDNGEVP